MNSSELYTFYRDRKFLSNLKVKINHDPAINLKQSDSYDGLPKDGIITAETIIKTLEAHS